RVSKRRVFSCGLGSVVANRYRRLSFEKGLPISRRLPPFAFLGIALCFIAGTWWWSALPISLPRAPIDPLAKLECGSYAPFRHGQSPFDEIGRASCRERV